MGTILDDTCVEAGKHVYGEANKLSELLKCGTTSAAKTTYKEVWEKLDTSQTASAGSSCTIVQESAYGFTSFTDGTVDDTAVNANSGEYDRNKAFTKGMYSTYGVVSSTCPTMTDNSKMGLCWVPDVSSSTYTSKCDPTSGTERTTCKCYHQQQILSSVGMTGSAYMIGCQHLDTIALDLNNNICEPMVSGLINVCVGQAFIGFFYFFVLAVGCMGINRFDKDHYSGKVHPEGETAGNPADSYKVDQVQTYKVDPMSGNYSAEQAMAATKIQSIQRQKVAKKRVQEKRDFRNKHH